MLTPSFLCRAAVLGPGLLLFLLLFIGHDARAAILTVGAPGTGCNHTNIQAAVNAANASAGADTIRIARSATYTAQQITINTSEELALIGGFASCSSATPSGGNTVLSGAGGNPAPVVSVAGSGFVTLQGLIIREGDNHLTPGTGLGGGIYFAGANALTILDTDIVDNQAVVGGGIYAFGTAPTSEVAVLDNVTIGFNTARDNGGGLVAAGLEFVVTGRNTTLLQNQALGTTSGSGFGGGALVISTPSFPSFLYVSAAGLGGLGAIHGNTAKFGGGISIFAGTDSGNNAEALVYTVYADAPARISANTATIAGGAIHAQPDADNFDGFGFAVARLWHAFVTDNSAPDGAAFFIGSDGYNAGLDDLGGDVFFSVGRPGGALPCPADAPCGAMSNNIAPLASGSIVRIRASGRFLADRLLVQNNQAQRLISRENTGRPASASLYNSLLTGNTTNAELIRMDDGSAFLRNVTVADNQIGTPHVFRGSTISLRNMVVSQPGRVTVSADTDASNSLYVLTNDNSNLPGGVGVLLAAPRFIDAARGDYRVRAGSRAIDFAANLLDTDSYRGDLIGSPRNIDVPNTGVIAPDRLLDLGAYERTAFQPLVLNADFDVDLNLWQGLDADSFWDATQNVAGGPGSGSARVVFDTDPVRAPKQAGRGQCIHLPGPGTYALNGSGRVVPSSSGINTNRARLTWSLRYNGGRFGCETGAADVTGTLNLASTSTWTRPAAPMLIEVPPGSWTQDTSINVVLDVIGGVINPPTAWFDGITLELQNDLIFANGFD